VVVKGQFTNDLRDYVGGDRLFASVLIVFLESGVDDAASDSEAAIAAEGPLPAENACLLTKPLVQRQSTVKTAVVVSDGC
jgi:hypothetical protein